MSESEHPPRDPAWLERARLVCPNHECRSIGPHWGERPKYDVCCTQIATLLAAVDTAAEARGREAEREECAQVAEACTPAGKSREWFACQAAIAESIRGRTRPTAPAPFPVSGEVRLSDLSQAFIDGAREARRNPSATDAQIVRASDGYVKLILKRQQDATAPARREDG